jgi:hypothetical protein
MLVLESTAQSHVVVEMSDGGWQRPREWLMLLPAAICRDTISQGSDKVESARLSSLRVGVGSQALAT